MNTRKYPALHSISKFYRFLAYLSAIGGVLGVVGGLVAMSSSVTTGIGILVGSVIYGLIGCATLLAISEAILVFLDIEANSRRSAEVIESHFGAAAHTLEQSAPGDHQVRLGA